MSLGYNQSTAEGAAPTSNNAIQASCSALEGLRGRIVRLTSRAHQIADSISGPQPPEPDRDGNAVKLSAIETTLEGQVRAFDIAIERLERAVTRIDNR